MSEKLDIHNRIRDYETSLNKFKNNSNISDDNKKLILDYLRDCELGKTVSCKQKKKLIEVTRHKHLRFLTMISLFFKKSLDQVTQEEMEEFILNLENNRILTKKEKYYSDSTKVDCKCSIRKFYKWLFGNNEIYPPLVNWIDTSLKENPISALTREEVERLADSCSLRDKAIIKILFDSGARIEEFLNLRIKDLKQIDDYYQIRIEHSKTKSRTISISLSTKELRSWLDVHPDKNNPEQFLWAIKNNEKIEPLTYDAVRMMLNRVGKRILNKRVYPHLLRHSSATYYCNRLNPYQLCYRYGWTMASKQPARYIDREGIQEKETAKIIKSDEIGKVHEENQKLKEEIFLIKSEFNKDRELFIRLNDMMNIIVKNPEIRKGMIDQLRKEGQGKIFKEIEYQR